MRNELNVKIKIIGGGKKPVKGTQGSACYDLYARSVTECNGLFWYDTGVCIEIPEGFCALVFPRSSVVNRGAMMANSVGVIDSDYRGEIRVCFVAGKKPYEAGDRIAQMMIVGVPDFRFEEVEELSETKRGDGGYGSTGQR